MFTVGAVSLALALSSVLPAPVGCASPERAVVQEDANRQKQPAPATSGTPRTAEEWRRTLGLKFVRIPAGEFEMGAADSEAFDNEKPVHRVRVAKFQIGKTEVTQAQWVAVMGANPSRFPGCNDCPVEKVSWDDAQEFIRKASALTGLSLRLPTEAEWEYAARGGARQQKWAGTDSAADLGNFAWIDLNSEGRTHPVCRKKPNVFGLCDMTGNVFEWVQDGAAKGYDATLPVENPADPATLSPRILRGGCWGYTARLARNAFRGSNAPSSKSGSIGFRLSIVSPP